MEVIAKVGIHLTNNSSSDKVKSSHPFCFVSMVIPTFDLVCMLCAQSCPTLLYPHRL